MLYHYTVIMIIHGIRRWADMCMCILHAFKSIFLWADRLQYKISIEGVFGWGWLNIRIVLCTSFKVIEFLDWWCIMFGWKYKSCIFPDKHHLLSTWTIINISLLFLAIYHYNSTGNSLKTEGSMKLFLTMCKVCPTSSDMVLYL